MAPAPPLHAVPDQLGLTPLRAARARALAHEVGANYAGHGARDLDELAFVLDWRQTDVEQAANDGATLGLIELCAHGSTIVADVPDDFGEGLQLAA
jgi:hypothetical protein